MSEYQCDRCATEVPNGNGHYIEDDRVCGECYFTSLQSANTYEIARRFQTIAHYLYESVWRMSESDMRSDALLALSILLATDLGSPPSEGDQ